MPKLIQYPRAPFSKALKMADAIDQSGGTATKRACAEWIGIKVTGAFAALTGAARKYKLVNIAKGILSVTETYRDIKLAPTNEAKLKLLQMAFLSPPVFRKLYENFKGKEFEAEKLDKLMIREYRVDHNSATRIAKYFIDGAKSCEILIDNKIIDLSTNVEQKPKNEQSITSDKILKNSTDMNDALGFLASHSYVVQVIGPDINSRVMLSGHDDFVILDAMISKLRRKVKIG